MDTTRAKYPVGDIPRPPFYGGYVLKPTFAEFWRSGGPALHDIVRYTLPQHDTPLAAAPLPAVPAKWKVERVAP